jgi:diguanylate cyclase (GGDEF)-like protein
MAQAENVCLAMLVAVVATNLAAWMFPSLAGMFPSGLQPMKAESVLAVVLCTIFLLLSDVGQTRWIERLSLLPAAAVVVICGAVLLKYRLDFLAGVDQPLPQTLGALMSQQSAIGFELLGCTMLLMKAHGRFAIRLADVLTFGLSLTVLTLVSGWVFGALRLYGVSASAPTSPQTLFCLMLLAIVVLLRRTGNGMFSIFTERGLGGRLARILSPIILVLPFLREGARAQILGGRQMPSDYLTAVLASLAAMVSFALLLYLAWRINGMEMEIHTLSLRDELTGLYNLRGFYLLAEQALRLAKRSKRPFSVIYVDLDNLKGINDSLGHQAGSTFLTETSEILQTTFRETDVLGRIGGDEFAVAGHFSRSAIAAAIQRLDACCEEKNAKDGRECRLSLSVGHVTTAETGTETLDDLLAGADEAMYEVKRGKKNRKLEDSAEQAGGKHGAQVV